MLQCSEVDSAVTVVVGRRGCGGHHSTTAVLWLWQHLTQQLTLTECDWHSWRPPLEMALAALESRQTLLYWE